MLIKQHWTREELKEEIDALSGLDEEMESEEGDFYRMLVFIGDRVEHLPRDEQKKLMRLLFAQKSLWENIGLYIEERIAALEAADIASKNRKLTVE